MASTGTAVTVAHPGSKEDSTNQQFLNEEPARSGRFSPSGRQLGGTALFTGIKRPMNFVDQVSGTPGRGLGLGITGSKKLRQGH